MEFNQPGFSSQQHHPYMSLNDIGYPSFNGSSQLTSGDETADFDNFAVFIVDGVLLALMIPLYSGTIFYLFIRRYHQPLKNRGSILILISTIGNFFNAMTLMLNKMIANAYKVGSFYDTPGQDVLPPPDQAIVELSCALSHIQYGVFMPLLFFPYYMRAYRLYLVYSSHIQHFDLKRKKGVLAFKKAKSLHCAREKNMVKWLAVVIAPLIVLSMVAVLSTELRKYFPSFEVKSCFLGKGQFIGQDIEEKFKLHLYLTVEVYLIFNFFLDALLMSFIYLLRKIQTEFSMAWELQVVTCVQLVMGFVIYLLLVVYPDSSINTSNGMQYILATRGLVFLYITAIAPLRASYNPNSIIPFPINEECIKTLEMALLMPTSANYFYEYLETLCGSEKSKDALVYFGLYADIRSYLRLLEEGQSEGEVRSVAQQLIDDYITPKSRQWDVEIPEEVVADLKNSLDPQNPGQLAEFSDLLNEQLFSSLYYFVLDVLEGYYSEFQRSRKYDQLKDEVAKQEILYEYLRRYSMISN